MFSSTLRAYNDAADGYLWKLSSSQADHLFSEVAKYVKFSYLLLVIELSTSLSEATNPL